MTDSMSVLGRVMCDASRTCKPGRVHRLDLDLELCVCSRCGNGWIRDVDPWTKVQEAFARLNQTLSKLSAASKSLESAVDRLNQALKA